MGLFEKIFGSPKSVTVPNASTTFETLTAYKPVFTSWNGSIYESELIRAAINARATHISKLSVDFRGAAQQTLKTRLKKAPNDWQTWGQFLARLSTILDVHNTAFIVPIIDKYGQRVGLYPILPDRCVIKEYKGELYLSYEFSNGRRGAIEYRLCGVLLRHQYRDDFFGASNKALAPTLDLIDIQNQGIKEGVQSAATYRFMAKKNNFQKPEDLAKEREAFNSMNFSADSRGGVLIFPNTYDDIKQIDSKPFVVDDKQMEAIQKNIYNYFGVNEKILQNAAIGDDMDAFFNGAIEPFAIQLSDVLTRMLFTDDEIGYGNRIYVTANRLQYMSISNKIQLAKELGDRGGIMIDEIRELFNYAPLPDGAGQMAPIRGEYYDVGTGKENETDEGDEVNADKT